MLASRTLLENSRHILSPKRIRVSPKLLLCDVSRRIGTTNAKIPSKSCRWGSTNASTFCVCPETKIWIEHFEPFPWCSRLQTKVQESHSYDISASPERTHPEASLSHFTKKTDRCPYPESSWKVSEFSPAVQLELEVLRYFYFSACLPTLQLCPLPWLQSFRPKLRFQSGHFTRPSRQMRSPIHLLRHGNSR